MRTSANMITVIVKMRSRAESPIRIFGGLPFDSARASVLCCVVLCCVVLCWVTPSIPVPYHILKLNEEA